MPIIISHNSALERFRAVPPACDSSIPIDRPFSLEGIRPDCRRAAHLDYSQFGVAQKPVHLLAAGPLPANESKSVVVHAHTPLELPAGALMHIRDDVFASGVELCFLQMAGRVSQLGAIALGFELCGAYSHFAPLVAGFYDRDPLTSRERIEEALASYKGCHGVRKARAALRWVLDGSASPMETVVACMMYLPSRMGGEGFCEPALNYRVELDEAGKRATGKSFSKVDLAWPDEKTGIEYFGDPYHADEKADRLRLEALAHKGWTVYVADIDRISRYEDYKKLLGLIDDVIPRRKGEAAPDAGASKALFKRLMRITRAGLGLEAALFAPSVPHGAVRLHVR